MVKIKVTLCCEQTADVVIDVPEEVWRDPATRVRHLSGLALAKLDESGGAEWETITGSVHATYAEEAR